MSQTPSQTERSGTENRLARETSPYLLQHKDNPVAWWPWGAEALAEAKRTGKPILLSVGYAACHWCHVMAHESFEDEATAAVMNELFVNIKVDREERPDIDQIYMSALHHLGEQGGWPLTMFLTPEGEPVWGGTYFPKTSRYGRPAFVDVLREVSRLFREEPAQDRTEPRCADGAARRAARRPAGKVVVGAGRARPARAADRRRVRSSARRHARRAEISQRALYELVWRAGMRTGDERFSSSWSSTRSSTSAKAASTTISAAASRAIRSMSKWLVPHFEKMLYDNAQLLELLALAYEQHERSALPRSGRRETVGWLASEMTIPKGAFCASLDANSEGEEGKFYVWSMAEIVSGAGCGRRCVFVQHYDVTAERQLRGPQYPQPPQALAAQRGGSRRGSRACAGQVLMLRATRVRPGLDDKVLADWNGEMIAALANAGTDVGRSRTWIDAGAARLRFHSQAT